MHFFHTVPSLQFSDWNSLSSFGLSIVLTHMHDPSHPPCNNTLWGYKAHYSIFSSLLFPSSAVQTFSWATWSKTPIIYDLPLMQVSKFHTHAKSKKKYSLDFSTGDWKQKILTAFSLLLISLRMQFLSVTIVHNIWTLTYIWRIYYLTFILGLFLCSWDFRLLKEFRSV